MNTKLIEGNAVRKELSFLGLPKYGIDSDGTPWTNVYGSWKKMRLTKSPEGYFNVSFRNNGKNKGFGVARLVLMAFDRMPKDNEIARHINGDKSDNRISNLVWGYHEDSMEVLYPKLTRNGVVKEEKYEILARDVLEEQKSGLLAQEKLASQHGSIEIWRDIVGYDGDYRVSNFGNVMTMKNTRGKRTSGRLLRIGVDKSTNVQKVKLHKNRVGRTICVHTLVLEAFVSMRPDNYECRHMDGNAGNNNLDNLRWGTHLENARDMIRHGTSTVGEKSGRASTTWDTVRNIRDDYETKQYTKRQLAEKYEISLRVVSEVLANRSWKEGDSTK